MAHRQINAHNWSAVLTAVLSRSSAQCRLSVRALLQPVHCRHTAPTCPRGLLRWGCCTSHISNEHWRFINGGSANTTGAIDYPASGKGGREGKKENGCLYYLSVSIGLLLCSWGASEKNFLRAVKDGDKTTINRYIKEGVEIHTRHPLGWTALHTAVMNNNIGVVKLLVEAGADVNIRDEFSTARRIARQRKVSHLEVEAIRDRDFCSWINHNTSFSGFTPLHYAVIVDNVQMVKYLLEKGADPTIQDNAGHLPAGYCTNSAIKRLLEEYITIFARRALEERRKFPLEDKLRQHIVGQEGPITAVAAAIRRREMGWGDNEHPLVFLFLGSSGIGKTELAKQVAKYIHKDNTKGFIRLDMSEYQEKHEVAKMIGAPPGYVGHEQGGQLTTYLRKCPSAVVLFDEVDKAHPDVLTVLLQLFDEGRLTDGKGSTIDCKEAIFVMTSNLASEEIASHGLQLRREAKEALSYYAHRNEEHDKTIEISREFKETIVEPILKRHFLRDEFLGRINEMVYFLPFSREELNQLVNQELVIWRDRAKERHSIQLTWNREVLDVLADGYNIKYGARSIHHEVERHVVNQLAAAYEQGIITKGSHVHLVVESRDKDPSVVRIQVKNTTSSQSK